MVLPRPVLCRHTQHQSPCAKAHEVRSLHRLARRTPLAVARRVWSTTASRGGAWTWSGQHLQSATAFPNGECRHMLEVGPSSVRPCAVRATHQAAHIWCRHKHALRPRAPPLVRCLSWLLKADDQGMQAPGCPCPARSAAQDRVLFRIGRTMFETDGLPQHLVRHVQAMDEVWVPTEFNRATFIAAGASERVPVCAGRARLSCLPRITHGRPLSTASAPCAQVWMLASCVSCHGASTAKCSTPASTSPCCCERCRARSCSPARHPGRMRGSSGPTVRHLLVAGVAAMSCCGVLLATTVPACLPACLPACWSHSIHVAVQVRGAQELGCAAASLPGGVQEQQPAC
jgi:hypothetical protein